MATGAGAKALGLERRSATSLLGRQRISRTCGRRLEVFSTQSCTTPLILRRYSLRCLRSAAPRAFAKSESKAVLYSQLPNRANHDACRVQRKDRTTFVEAIGWVFEDSPWVAERAWDKRPFATLEALHDTMASVVAAATLEEQLSLLRAHPDLGAVRLKPDTTSSVRRAGPISPASTGSVRFEADQISPASQREQAGAGLDALRRDELDRLRALNAAYRQKFGFPFLYAVKGSTTARHSQRARAPADLGARRRASGSVTAGVSHRPLSIGGDDAPREYGFASGPKRHYYGKGDVLAYRLHRDGTAPAGGSPVFGANVLLLLYGDAFWKTYTEGDNSGLIATDSMKNFIQRETMNFDGNNLEEYCRFLGEKFLARYAQVEGLQISASEIPYSPLGRNVAFEPSGPEPRSARLEIDRSGIVEAVSGVRGFKFLRLGGSAFRGFVRDEYTTLPDLHNRPLHMWLELEWTYATAADAFSGGAVTSSARRIVRDMFVSFESGSIQQVIYQMGTGMLAEIPAIAEVRLEANNRTWDTIAERGEELGVYTDARPPYGCLGLTLKREDLNRRSGD